MIYFSITLTHCLTLKNKVSTMSPFFVYITEECKLQAKKFGLEKQIENTANQIKNSQTTSYYLEGYKDTKKFLKDRFGDKRLLVGRYNDKNGNNLLVFWKILSRSDKNYDKFLSDSSYFERQFDNDCEKLELELENYLKEQINQSQAIKEPSLKDLTETEEKFLREIHEKTLLINEEEMIYETEEWVNQIGNYEDYLETIYDLVREAYNKKNSESPDIRSQNSNGIKTKFNDQKNIGINYTYKQNNLILISPTRTLESSESKQDPILRIRRRAYPCYVLTAYEDWKDIQKDEKANLVLSPEEAGIVESANKGIYPLFINGQPGSGKTTILHFLFAHILYFNHTVSKLEAKPLYLTYSTKLREDAQKNIQKILTSNWEKTAEIKLGKEEANKLVNDSVKDFQSYLLELLGSEKQHFSKDRYVNFARFRNEFESKLKSNNKKEIREITAELAWHVIRTYIKGWSFKEELDPEEFNELTIKNKSVTYQTFNNIHTTVWKWYKDWSKKNECWDDQDLVRQVLERSFDGSLKLPEHCAVFCDEAQDFTRNELFLIGKLFLFSKRRIYNALLKKLPIAFAGDPFQTLNPTGFDWSSVQSDFYSILIELLDRSGKGSLKFNFQNLSYNYRSYRSIVNFCNLIHLIRGIAFKKTDLEPQKTWSDDSENNPTPSLPIPYYNVEERFLEKRIFDKSFVIIIPSESNIEDLLKNDELLNKGFYENTKERSQLNILTPFEAKGLEYPKVILYKFGEEVIQNYRDLLDLINYQEKTGGLGDEKQNSPDSNIEKQIPVEYFVNALYVAASRAMKNLFIIDTDKGLKEFWEEFFKSSHFSDYLKCYQNHKGSPNQEAVWKVELLNEIQKGSEKNLYADSAEDREDIKLNADNWFEVGKREQDKTSLQLAKNNYQSLKDGQKVKECDAYIKRIEGKLKEAGMIFEEIRAYKEAESLYWEAGAWQRLVTLSTLSKDNPRKKAAEFLLKFEEYTFKDAQLLLEEFSNLIEKKDESIEKDRSWKGVFSKLYGFLTRKEENEELLDVGDWRKIYNKAQKHIQYGYISKEKDFVTKLNVWQTPYPEKLKLVQTDHQMVLKYFDKFSKDFPLNKEHLEEFRIVRNVLKANKRYEDLEKLIKNKDFQSFENYSDLLVVYVNNEQKDSAQKWFEELKEFAEKQIRSGKRIELSQESYKNLSESLLNKKQYQLLEDITGLLSGVEKYIDLMMLYAEKLPNEERLTYLIERLQNNNLFRGLKSDQYQKIQSALLNKKGYRILSKVIQLDPEPNRYIDLLMFYVGKNYREEVNKLLDDLSSFSNKYKSKTSKTRVFEEQQYRKVWDEFSKKKYFTELEKLLRTAPHLQSSLKLLVYYLNTEEQSAQKWLEVVVEHLNQQYRNGLKEDLTAEENRPYLEELIKKQRFNELERLIEATYNLENYVFLLSRYIRENPDRIEKWVEKIFGLLINQYKNWQDAFDFVNKRELHTQNEEYLQAVRGFDWKNNLDVYFIKFLASAPVPEEKAIQKQIIEYLRDKLIHKASTFSKEISFSLGCDVIKKMNLIEEEKVFLQSVLDKKWPASEEEIVFAKQRLSRIQENTQLNQGVIELEIVLTYNQNQLNCRVNRLKSKMTIRYNQDMVTVNGETLSVERSDMEFDSQIKQVSKTEKETIYYVQPWQLWFAIRRQDEAVYATLKSGEEKSELFTMRIS